LPSDRVFILLVLVGAALLAGAALRWGPRGGFRVFLGGYALCFLIWLAMLGSAKIIGVNDAKFDYLLWRGLSVSEARSVFWTLVGGFALVFGLVAHRVARAKGASWTQVVARTDIAAFD
jgi:hypothetical protein